MRQAAALSPEYGGSIPGLAVEKLEHAFLTHLHSDHTVGLPDLILTSWTIGRDSPLKLFGPEGTRHMAETVLEAYEEDIRYRLYSEQPANNQGWRVDARAISQSPEIPWGGSAPPDPPDMDSPVRLPAGICICLDVL